MSTDEAISIAKNEAWALAYLTAVLENPYLVRYYNSWLEGSMLHLVVSWCDGRSNVAKEASLI